VSPKGKPGLDNPRNLLTSLVLVFPLLLVYQVGVLFTLPMLNGADFVTTFLFRNLGFSKAEYLAFVGLVLVLFVVAVALLRRRQRFNPRVVLPVLLESTIYALSMGSLIILVMTKVLGISPRLAASLESQGILTRFVMSLGAGVYEELVFRLGLLGGLYLLAERVLGWGRWVALPAALLLSSVAFSAVHHIPPYGDPLSLGIFTFRVLAGIFFGVLFWFRGFAVAVYTHAFYDVYVLLLR
jgi:membrane protease YdiL (CAAX protease family)